MSRGAVFFDGSAFPDPVNRQNIFLSYYTWGSVVAAGLDLTLRTRFNKTLDDYMRLLWNDFGKYQSAQFAPTRPYTRKDLEAELAKFTGSTSFARDFFARYIEGREVPDFARLLEPGGFRLVTDSVEKPYLGASLEDDSSGVWVNWSQQGGSLYDAGIANSDVIISLNGERTMTVDALNAALARRKPGEVVQVGVIQQRVQKTIPMTLRGRRSMRIVTYDVHDPQRRQTSYRGSELAMRRHHADPLMRVLLLLAACTGGDGGGDTSGALPGETGGSAATGADDDGDDGPADDGDTADDGGSSSSGSPATSSPDADSSVGSSEGSGSSEDGNDDSSGDSGEPSDCTADEPIGWAAQEGGTQGGAGGPVTMVDNAADLLELAAADGPQVIVVSGEISLDERLDITSYKTLEGAPGGATIHGTIAIHGDEDAPIEHVIVRNLYLDASNGPTEDAFSMQWAIHVWVDHCDIADGADGNLDMTHGTDLVTVSWTRFHYTDQAPDPAHRFCNLIGHSDGNASEDEQALDVTMHHNWWTEGVVERMPRVRFGQVHVFNNLFDSPDTNYAVRAGVQSEILVEANYFDGIANPPEIYDAGAEIVAVDNVYDNTSGAQDQDGDAFVPPYAYTPDPAEAVLRIVPSCAGPQ
jgi:pectate lyase